MVPLSVSHALIVGVFLLSAACWVAPSLADAVALVPAYTLPPNTYVWNLATSVFVEPSVWWLLTDVAALHAIGPAIAEDPWDRCGAAFPHSYRTYLLITVVSTNAVLLVASFTAYVSGFQFFLYQRYGGFLPSSIAIAVAAARVAPRSDSRQPWIAAAPWVLLGGAVVSAIVFPNPTPTEAEISFGHLRPKGSHLLQAVVSFLAASIYCRVYGPLEAPVADAGGNSLMATPSVVCVLSEGPSPQVRPLPGSTSTDADRRRQVALAALAARLKKVEEDDSHGDIASPTAGKKD